MVYRLTAIYLARIVTLAWQCDTSLYTSPLLLDAKGEAWQIAFASRSSYCVLTHAQSRVGSPGGGLLGGCSGLGLSKVLRATFRFMHARVASLHIEDHGSKGFRYRT